MPIMRIDRNEYDSEEPLMSSDEGKRKGYEWRASGGYLWDQGNGKARRSSLLHLIVFIPWLLLIGLGALHWVEYQKYKNGFVAPQLAYSPVQHLIEYELRFFNRGVGDDLSEYQGEPSEELDKKWLELYPSLYQLIPLEQAKRLWSKTVIFPHDKQRRYMVELDVFHQLHCLNMIRKAFRPDYYKPQLPLEDGEDALLGPHHVSHCIEVIRQALVCASDVTVYTWEWNETLQYHTNQFKTPHTCRNFDKIREWATINGGVYKFDAEYREMNDPLDPDTWVDGYSGE